MNNKIDVNDIIRELEEKIRTGLDEKSLDITGISKLIGEHHEKAKEKVLQDAGTLVSNEVEACNSIDCKKCGKRLKKTKS